MSVTDTINPKEHIEVANGILNIQKLAIQMASFGASKKINVWLNPVDDFTLDYLSAYFSVLIQPEDKIAGTNKYIVIKNQYSEIYVNLK